MHTFGSLRTLLIACVLAGAACDAGTHPSDSAVDSVATEASSLRGARGPLPLSSPPFPDPDAFGMPLGSVPKDESALRADIARGAAVRGKPQAPHNLSPPAILGTARVGMPLTASAGTWNPKPDSMDIFWRRRHPSGGPGEWIARGSSYVPTASDLGQELDLRVIAFGPRGRGLASSAPTAPVLPPFPPPRERTAPSIAGVPREGSTLIGAAGEWDGVVDATQIEWLRCGLDLAGCERVASGESYLLGASDVGYALHLEVAVSGPGGTSFAASAPTAPIQAAAPALVEAPRLDGTARDGAQLVASPGTWANRVTELILEWQRCTPAGSCQALPGGEASRTLTYADVGSTIRVAVTAIGPGGRTHAFSALSPIVLAAGPQLVRPPALSGALSVGATLALDRGGFSGTAPLSFAVQWLRCDAGGGVCEGVGGDGDAYRLTSADKGSRIGARVTVSNAAGSVAAEVFAPEAADDPSSSNRYLSAVLAGRPLALWRLDEPGGSTVRDSSGNGVGGTYVGGVALQQPGAVAGNTSAQLNGTSGRATFGDRFDFTGNAPFTLEAWIRPTTIDAWHRRIVGKEEKNAANRFEGYRFAMDTSLGLYCERWSNGTNAGLVNAPASQFAAGTWYHVACVYDGAALRLYVNGTLKAAKASPQAVANTAAAFHLGSYTNGGSASFWAGNLDEVAVFDRALTGDELAAHREASVAAPPRALESPTISGRPNTDSRLEASAGLWTGATPLSFTYQWLRCGSDGLACQPIPDATEQSYLPDGTSAGATLRVEIRARNAAGTATAVSAASGPISEPEPFTYCVEAEDAEPLGTVHRWAASIEAAGATVVLGAHGAGGLRIPFLLAQSASLHAFARVRTPTGAHRVLGAGLEPLPSGAASLPISGVLRWQPVRPGGELVTAGRGAPAWPGLLPAGEHVLTLVGVDADVEIDAVCLTSSARGPAERFPAVPRRPIARSVRDFGAVGDGLADDTQALRAALASLVPGEALFVPAGRYRFTSTLEIRKSEVSLVGEGPQSVLYADFPSTSSGNALQIVGGYESSGFALLEDAAALSRSVRVSESAPFAAGDTVVVGSDPWGPTAPNLPTPFYRNRANLLRVTEVRRRPGSTELVFDRPLLSLFSPAYGARVERFNGLRGVTVESLRVEGTAQPVAAENADINLIWASRCERCSFVDLELVHARKSGLEIARALDCQVLRVHAHDVSDTGGGGHGYGVALTMAQGTVVRESRFDGLLRHGVTVSWGSRENFVFANLFDRRVPDANAFASVDVHGQDDYANLVEGNRILGGQEGIIVGGGGTSHGNDGPWNVVRGNRVEGCLYGIPVYKMTYDTVLESNVVLDSGAYGIRIDSGSDRAQVLANRISGYGLAGIFVNASEDATVRGNQLAGGEAVQIVGSTRYRLEQNDLQGGTVNHPGTGSVESNW